MLLKDADKLKNSEPYRFDVIDVQRQMMTNMGQVIHKRAAEAFLNRDKEAFALYSINKPEPQTLGYCFKAVIYWLEASKRKSPCILIRPPKLCILEEEKKLYGTYGIYAADPFHESAPPVNTPEYLSAVGHAIYKLIKDFDPKAKWAMQAWSLREPIVKAVPQNDLIILDLNGEKIKGRKGFWGYPAVEGNLHNFGGRINMHGDLRLLAASGYLSFNSRGT